MAFNNLTKALVLLCLSGIIPAAHAEGWEDFYRPIMSQQAYYEDQNAVNANLAAYDDNAGFALTAIEAPEDNRPIGGDYKYSLGNTGSAQGRMYGGRLLPAVSMSSVNIHVTDGLGGFNLKGSDIGKFNDMAMSEKFPGPAESPVASHGDTLSNYQNNGGASGARGAK